MLANTEGEGFNVSIGCGHGAPYMADDQSPAWAVDVQTLAPGTELVVDTLNSRYHLVVIDRSDRSVLVHGGALFDAATPARIEGSVSGGIVLRPGWITVGRSLGLIDGERRVVTSPVRSIVVAAMH